MTPKFPISTLDTYAKAITLKQAAALYEHKTNKKATKALFENKPISQPTGYTFYLSPYIIRQHIVRKFPKKSVEESIREILGCNFEDITFVNDVYEPGIMVIIKDPDLYQGLIDALIEEFNVPDEIIEDNIDQKYLNEN